MYLSICFNRTLDTQLQEAKVYDTYHMAMNDPWSAWLWQRCPTTSNDGAWTKIQGVHLKQHKLIETLSLGRFD